MRAAPLRVQHVPSGHPYVRAVHEPSSTLLPDPPVPGAPPGRWWPHPALDAAWVMQLADAVDVVHVHFGFEHLQAHELRAWVAALRRAGIGLVVTVHDLTNPHLEDQTDYLALLDVLVPAADALTTLTPGAAAAIEKRWGRRTVVHPHPHVVDATWLERPRARPGHAPSGADPRPWVVGVHAKSLRANVDLDTIRDAARAVADLPGAVLRVHLHRDVLDPAHPRHDPALGALLADRSGRLDVRIHEPLSDAQLWSELLATDLALLPYRRGTHSGWLEMCHDLGTDVLAPETGFFGQQRPVRTYGSGSRERGLADALRAAHGDHRRGRTPHRPAAALRLAERDAVRRVHHRLHHQVARTAGATG